MNTLIIPAFPPGTGTGYDQFTESPLALSGAQYTAVFTWRARLQAWYVDLYAIDGTALVTGMRVTPGWAPWGGLQIDGLPPGLFVPLGPDPYVENNLGETVFLSYLTDLPTPPANPYGLRVVTS